MDMDIDDIDWSDATKPDLITAVKFGLLFGGYIREMNPDLHQKARDWAYDNMSREELIRFFEGMNDETN